MYQLLLCIRYSLLLYVYTAHLKKVWRLWGLKWIKNENNLTVNAVLVFSLIIFASQIKHPVFLYYRFFTRFFASQITKCCEDSLPRKPTKLVHGLNVKWMPLQLSEWDCRYLSKLSVQSKNQSCSYPLDNLSMVHFRVHWKTSSTDSKNTNKPCTLTNHISRS